MSAGRSRITAPFGRRRVAITGRAEHGAYVVISCADPGGPLPDPGQFYMLAAAERWGGGDGERPFLPRAFSVMRARPGVRGAGTGHGAHLEFLLEDVGPGTKRLCELQVGDGLYIVGPLGAGFTAPPDGRRPLLVGGGVGIAPLLIWQDALGRYTPALLGFRDAPRVLAAGLFTLALVATDDGSAGHHGLVTDLLAMELANDDHAFVYACGPPPMLEAVRAMCAERGVPAQLALESGMACGYGACFGCVVPTTRGLIRLCVEGPVLDADLLEHVA